MHGLAGTGILRPPVGLFRGRAESIISYASRDRQSAGCGHAGPGYGAAGDGARLAHDRTALPAPYCAACHALSWRNDHGSAGVARRRFPDRFRLLLRRPFLLPWTGNPEMGQSNALCFRAAVPERAD